MTRRAAQVGFLVFALSGQSQDVACRRQATAAQSDAAAVLRAALHHALVDPGDLPDRALVADAEELIVRATIPRSEIRIPPEALPKIEGKTLRLLSEQEIQALAGGHGDLYVVAVNELSMEKDAASLVVGVAMVTSPARPSLCCCSAKVHYAREHGAWVYKRTSQQICS
jgi:hypothetical protein